MQDTLEDISLTHDNGEDMHFRGSLSSTGPEEHSRRAYRLKVQDETCIIHNGKAEVRMPIALLMLAVRGLCGMDARSATSLAMVEEMLKAANA